MTAMPGRNPYRPGVGTPPLRFAGRDREIGRFRSILRSAPEIPPNVRLTGLRGVGKTVLLTKFGEVARDEGWMSHQLELEPRHNKESDLVAALAEAFENLRRKASSTERVRARVKGAGRGLAGAEVAWGQLSFKLPEFDYYEARELSAVLLETARSVRTAGYHGLVLLLDEGQVLRDDRDRNGEHPLSMLLAAFSSLQREEVPVGLVLCGLPTLTTNLLSARTYTERMFRAEEIGTLPQEAAREAFVGPLEGSGVECPDDVIATVLRAVEGYPYFLQLWGAELWDAADLADVQHFSRELLREVEPDIYRRLDLEFYEPRVQALTPAEQDLLIASGGCSYPPLRVADLNGRVDKTASNINVLLGRLVASGVLYRLRKGQYEYTAPKFYEFLQRRRP